MPDLAFNDIPLSLENVDTCEKRHPSNSEPKQRKKRNPRPDETEMFVDALKRLIADYPPPISRSTSITRSNGDNNERPLPCGSPTPRGDTLRSSSVRSHPTAVNSSRSFKQKTQKRHNIEQDFAAIRSREEHTSSGQDATGFPKYQDKGVMVSPWMHQRTSTDHELRQTGAESSNSGAEMHMPNATSTIPIPKSREEEVEELVFRAKGIEGPTYPRDRMPPMSCFDSTSSHYPSNALFPPFASGLAPFDRSNVSKVIDTSNRDAYSIDWPAKSIAFQTRQEAFPAANAVSHRISQIVDDIPGETLKEYIDRMEREILGTSEPSMDYIDKTPYLTEANVLNARKQSSRPTREIQYRHRVPQKNTHEMVDIFPKQYPRLSDLEEGPNKSEPTFVWQPNHMMWR